MTTKKIKSSDILGDNYYIYNLTSSNYTPNLNGSITITCTVKNIYGDAITNKSIQLYQNDTAVGNATTTNNNGVATWTITCSTAGVQKFSVKDAVIEIFVDTTSKTGHSHTTSDITDFPEIPTKTSDLTNDSNFLTSHQSLTNYIQKSNTNGLIKNDGTIDTNTYLTTHQDISDKVNTSDLGETAFSNDYNDLDNLPTIPAAYTHPSTHPATMITGLSTVATSGSYNDLSNKPSIPTKTSDLTNDSGYLTTHQDISGKEDTSNKSSSITTDTGSTSKYPTVKAVEDYAEPKQEPGTFTELIALINNAPTGATITLDKDYINSEGLTGNIILPNEIHIDGNGHILDFNYANYSFSFNGEKSSVKNWIVEHFQYNIFIIGFKNIVIDNCIFRNSNSNLQSTNNLILTNSATNFLMVNCQFYNIKISSLRLITLHGIKQYIKNCIFYNNYCYNVIYSNGGNKLVNNTVSCVFENNIVYDGIIKHNASDNINTIVDCIFNNNTASSGNGSAINCKQNTVLINNKFITSNDTVYPTTLVNKDYLTEHQDISSKVDSSDLATVATSGSYNDLEDLPTIPSAYTHPSTHSSSMITDSNTHSNIGNTANTLENIITNIDTKLGSLVNVDLIEVTSSLGTASANTMNKLYLVAETTGATNDNYEVFVTVRTGTSGNYSYSWEKVDTARIDLSDYLTTANAQQTYVAKESGKGLSSNDYTTTEKNKLAGLHTVATSGSYNDLTDKPTIPTVPTNVSAFTNDSGYLTSQDISGKANITDLGNLAYEDDIDLSTHDVSELTDTSDTAFTPKTHSHSISDVTNLQTSLNGKINTSDIANNLTTSTTGQVLDASQGKWLDDNKASSTHTHGNINNDGTITTVKTIDSNTNVGADYFIIRDNNDSNSTKSANVLDVLNKIVLDLIDEGES